MVLNRGVVDITNYAGFRLFLNSIESYLRVPADYSVIKNGIFKSKKRQRTTVIEVKNYFKNCVGVILCLTYVGSAYQGCQVRKNKKTQILPLAVSKEKNSLMEKDKIFKGN